jgi:hypothetical protein
MNILVSDVENWRFDKGENKIKLQFVYIFLFSVLLKIFTNVMLAVPLKMHGRL